MAAGVSVAADSWQLTRAGGAGSRLGSRARCAGAETGVSRGRATPTLAIPPTSTPSPSGAPPRATPPPQSVAARTSLRRGGRSLLRPPEGSRCEAVGQRIWRRARYSVTAPNSYPVSRDRWIDPRSGGSKVSKSVDSNAFGVISPAVRGTVSEPIPVLSLSLTQKLTVRVGVGALALRSRGRHGSVLGVRPGGSGCAGDSEDI
eukprot:6264767-Pyramimonas_sp.AAC.1